MNNNQSKKNIACPYETWFQRYKHFLEKTVDFSKKNNIIFIMSHL